MKCPFCGTDNPAGEMFCGNCGGSLDPTTAPPTVVTGGGTATVVSNASTTGSTTATSPTSGASSGTLTPNSRLQNGRYVVEKILGQGGMGAAVLAKDTRVSNKRVVIKELISDNADPTQRQEDVRNFVREVDTLANLDHPLIPTVTDSFQEGSHYFMV
jgi:eukaryotic-like serine/threonine-protein kinase